MSVWFCITAVTSMIIAVVASVGLGSLAGAAGKSDATAGTVVLGGLILWLGFLAWLWCTLVRIARGWGAERLGAPTFRSMQVTFLVITASTTLARGVASKERNVFPVVLLAFDTVIVGMICVFLLLAWSARCRVPWRTYAEVFVMAAMLAFEIFLIKPWTY
jgi:hypothetical protein